MNKPLITIITVCFNAISSIEKTILSVINQTYPNIEYIIIDGSSTDGTIDVIKKYDDKITYWISEPDKGIYDAMNKGIDLAKGEWINFMNCGDTFYSKFIIENLIKRINSDSDIIYGDTSIQTAIGKYIKSASIVSERNYMPFVHQSSFVKTFILKNEMFDTNFKICADRNFFYQSFKKKFKFQYVKLVISNFEAEASFSSNNLIKLEREKGIIEGKTNNITWQIAFFIFTLKIKIKQFVKKILPERVVLFLRKQKNKNRLS